MDNPIKVLIVDDSALVRKIFSDIINQDPALEVVGIAQNGKIALRKMEALHPDIVTLDVQMPELDGFGVLKEMISKQCNSKAIMVSGLTSEGADTTLKALELGAVDFIAKPSSRSSDLKELSESLITKIHEIAKVDVKNIKPVNKIEKPITKIVSTGKIPKKIVAIGTSTGGPNALKELFQDSCLPEDCAYLIVQHMPREFTGPFADRLNQISKIRVKEAKDKDPILTGWAYLAPGDSHLQIEFFNNIPYTRLSQTGKVCGHQPSIDVLFYSVAKWCSRSSVAVIMTGMGRDGAMGIREIREKGGDTIAQDKDTSVVYGMNKEAIDIGAINKIVPLKDIPSTIQSSLNQR